MLKISIAFDGPQFSSGALQFAFRLNEVKPALLSGCFLKQSDFANLWNPVPLLAVADMGGQDENLLVKSNQEKFSKACEERNIHFRMEDSFDTVGYYGLKKQSRFSDALILGSETFFQNVSDHIPNQYLKDLLHLSECPIFLVPESFQFPEQVILSYDGSESSVYAIKQFAQLFPELCDKTAKLVYYSHKEEAIPDLKDIKAFAACHFDNLGFINLHGPGGWSLDEWLQEIKNPLVVSGSFGRSDVSETIRKSFVTDIIRDHNAILFIAHK